MKKELSKILIDMGKLVFGGVVLAGVMRQDISPMLLLIVGIGVTAATLSMGLFLNLLDEKQKQKL